MEGRPHNQPLLFSSVVNAVYSSSLFRTTPASVFSQGFIQDFTAGWVGQVKGHVSLELFWKYPTNGKDLGITKVT